MPIHKSNVQLIFKKICRVCGMKSKFTLCILFDLIASIKHENTQNIEYSSYLAIMINDVQQQCNPN